MITLRMDIFVRRICINLLLLTLWFASSHAQFKRHSVDVNETKLLTKKYTWEPIEVTKGPDHPVEGKLASKLIGQPVYVSLTTISSRVKSVAESVETLLRGTLIPDQIFVVISRNPHLIDAGVKVVPKTLLNLAKHNPVSIIYTDNIGPHRKLVPLLRLKWNEDCVIVTFDDDLGRKPKSSHLYQLIKYYLASGRESVVGLRTRRIGVCDRAKPTQVQFSIIIIILFISRFNDKNEG